MGLLMVTLMVLFLVVLAAPSAEMVIVLVGVVLAGAFTLRLMFSSWDRHTGGKSKYGR